MLLKYIFSGNALIPQPVQEGSEINRSFLFGDGFFETIRLGKGGFCPLAPHHAARISRSASCLAFREWESFTETKFRALLDSMELPEKDQDWKIKLVFYREGAGSYAPDEMAYSNLMAFCEPLEAPFFQKINRIEKSGQVTIIPSGWGWMKSTSALPYVLAGMERRSKNVDEIILCSAEDLIVEGSYTSICWKDADGLHFTPRKLGGIDGCQRRFLENYLKESGCLASEKAVTFSDLMKEAHWIAFLSGLGIRIFHCLEMPDLIPPELEAYPVSGYRFR